MHDDSSIYLLHILYMYINMKFNPNLKLCVLVYPSLVDISIALLTQH